MIKIKIYSFDNVIEITRKNCPYPCSQEIRCSEISPEKCRKHLIKAQKKAIKNKLKNAPEYIDTIKRESIKECEKINENNKLYGRIGRLEIIVKNSIPGEVTFVNTSDIEMYNLSSYLTFSGNRHFVALYIDNEEYCLYV